jgi:hypothetical protein
MKENLWISELKIKTQLSNFFAVIEVVFELIVDDYLQNVDCEM